MVFAHWRAATRLLLIILVAASLSAATQQPQTRPQNPETELPQPELPPQPDTAKPEQQPEQPAQNQEQAAPTVQQSGPQAEQPPQKVETPAPSKVSHLRNDSPERAWQILKTGAADHSFEKRASAVRALGLLPNSPAAITLAEKALEDEHPEVRAAGAAALGEMGAKRSIRNLRAVLDDKDLSVVLAAANSLKTFHDPVAYQVYYAVLTGQRKSGKGLLAEQEKMLRDRKKMMLFGVQEGIGFVPFGGIGYTAVKTLMRDDSSSVRADAAKALAKDPDPRSAKALKEATMDRSSLVRTAALDAIARREDPKLLATAFDCVDDEKDSVRFTAAAAALRLEHVSAIRQKHNTKQR